MDSIGNSAINGTSTRAITRAIVVGIDGSANSDAALDWAITEASSRRRPLHLFSAGVRQIPGGDAIYNDSELDAAVTRQALVAAVEHLAAAAARVRERSPDLDITTESAVDRAAGGLVDLSARADTIVVGRSGHGRMVGTLLGSVALQVVTHAQCPVVVVHQTNGDPAKARGVVVGIDGSGASGLALSYAFEQASWRGVHLDVVHAWWTTVPSGLTQGVRADQVTRERLILSEVLVGWSEKYPDVEVRESLPMGPTVLTLTEAAENAELLVVGSRGRGGFRSLLLGSVSQGVLQHAPCAVAVVRAQGDDHVR
jgi:nucleotide-binding universal stress UspA family protein